MTIRPRLLLSAILAVLVVAGGSALDSRLDPRRTSAGAAGRAPSGVWFCPHGALWETWVAVGNPGDEPSTVRVTSFGPKGVGLEETFELEGGADRYLEVGGGGTMVEYFGAPVAAGWVSREEDAVAAESCRASAGRHWVVADGNTETADPVRDSWLVVMNPFAEDAAFDVTLLTTEEAPTRVGSLRGYVLEGRRSVTFKLNNYLLNKPAIAAEVSVALGSVSVAQLGSTAGVGIRAAGAVPRAARHWVLPSALGRGDSALAVANVGEVSAAFTVRQQTHQEQRPIESLTGELNDVSLRGPSVRAFDTAGDGGPAGLVLDVTGEQPVAVARRTLGPNGDVAAISGASTAGSSWVVPPTVPPEGGGQQRVVLENPGREDVTVRVTLFGANPEDLGEVTVPAGRTIAVGPEDPAEGEVAPVWALVVADDGTFVAGSASLSEGGSAYALSIGAPLTLQP